MNARPLSNIATQAQKRGINEANPKAGQLSAKVEAAKSVERTRAADAEERLVVS
jgi:hypothetical protein